MDKFFDKLSLIFNFEDISKIKFVFYQALIAFFHTGNLF